MLTLKLYENERAHEVQDIFEEFQFILCEILLRHRFGSLEGLCSWFWLGAHQPRFAQGSPGFCLWSWCHY